MLAFCSESPLGSYSEPPYSDFPQNITKHTLVQKQWYVTMVRWSEQRGVSEWWVMVREPFEGIAWLHGTEWVFNTCSIQKHASGHPVGGVSSHTKGHWHWVSHGGDEEPASWKWWTTVYVFCFKGPFEKGLGGFLLNEDWILKGTIHLPSLENRLLWREHSFFTFLWWCYLCVHIGFCVSLLLIK